MAQTSEFLAQCVRGSFDMVYRTPEYIENRGLDFVNTPAWRLMGYALDACISVHMASRLLPAPAADQYTAIKAPCCADMVQA